MKLQESTQVVIDESTFYIRPFSAFTAANISGEVVKVIVPLLGSLLPFMKSDDEEGETKSVLDEDVKEIAPELAKGFESLSGDKCEILLRRLLVKHGNIAVEREGQAIPLTEDLVNELFCGEVQNMYVLAFHVIKVNYGGFFKKLGGQSGKAVELLQKIAK